MTFNKISRKTKERMCNTNENIFIDGKNVQNKVKESQSKKELYARAINRCCMPGCRFGYNLEVHHINPISKGGTDTFDNYIVLCKFCHSHSKIHSRSEENRLSLMVYKLIIEKEIIGASADQYSDDEFRSKIKSLLSGCEDKSINLKEERRRANELAKALGNPLPYPLQEEDIINKEEDGSIKHYED